MTPTPYAGIAGFTTPDEPRAVLAAMPAHPVRKLGVGVLTTSSILLGEGISNPRRYPPRSRIADIFPDDPRAVNLVHVAWKPMERFGSVYDQLMRARDAGGDRCHGLQVNGVQAALPGDFKAYARAYPNDRLVFQFRNTALPAKQIATALLLYGWSITDVLFDASAGEGKPMNVMHMAEVLSTIRESYPHLGIGVAGALFADVLPLLQIPLLNVPRVSTDAESKLRTESDQLDIKKATAWMDAHERLFSHA